MPSVRVLLTPAAEPVERDAAAVIVDVLRATSTLTYALANGAARVLPVASPDAAFALRRQEPTALLCGEREGRLIPGFDLGNSPAEYTRERVGGRPLIFASTNGSIAMLNARAAHRRILGAFVNAGAVAAAVARESRVTIVCAGKLGHLSLEDAAFAGWLARDLHARGFRIDGPAAAMAITLAPRDPAAIAPLLESAAHGRYLRALGGEFLADISRCAQLDAIDRAFEV